MSSGHLLEVEDLSVSFRLRSGVLNAVREVSFSVSRGETLAIVGESGCGKSATSLALMGLLPETAKVSAQRLLFQGTDLLTCGARAFSDLRGNRLAMIFQEPMTALNPTLSIGNQLAEPMIRHQGSTRAQALAKATDLLDRVGVPKPAARIHQYPHELSGGMRQRVVIAMALMCEPALLIADEPTTALDVTTQAQILRLLRRLGDELDMGMVLITHDFGVVRQIATKTAVMYAGQIVEAGLTKDVLAEPGHPYTKGLLASLPERWPPGSELGTIAGVVPSLLRPPVGCAFADRCSVVYDACRGASVPILPTRDGRQLRCLRRQDIAQTAMRELS